MTTDEQLRHDFDDFLEAGDDRVLLQVVRDLQRTFPARRPPAVLHRQIEASLAEHAGAHSNRRPARIPGGKMWLRRRVTVAALLLVVAAVALGTSGLANAAIDTMRTHLFSNPPASPQAAVWVGSMEIPMWGGCAPHRTSTPITAPDGRRIAQLDPVPSGLSSSVSVVFTPCWPKPPTRKVRTPSPSLNAWETVRILSVIRYNGASGSVELITGQATAEGMRRGLYLGNPAGTLADGTRVFDLVCTGGCAHRDNLRWLKDGLIVSLSGDLTVDQLKTLAADVTVE